MKNGICPKCGASDIQRIPNTGAHRDYLLNATFFTSVKLNEYVCCGCGLVETYLADLSDVEKIKRKCTKVEPKE